MHDAIQIRLHDVSQAPRLAMDQEVRQASVAADWPLTKVNHTMQSCHTFGWLIITDSSRLAPCDKLAKAQQRRLDVFKIRGTELETF